MDSIANKANISKRTLYEYFDDKETLLVYALELNYVYYIDVIKTLERDSESIIDVFVYLYDKLMHMPRWYSKKFYDDLKKFPRAVELVENHSNQFHQTLLKWFKKGVETGVFHSDINFEIVVLLARGYVKMIRPSQIFSEFSSKDVYNTILLVFIRGICTEKGSEILERHLRKVKYSLVNN